MREEISLLKGKTNKNHEFYWISDNLWTNAFYGSVLEANLHLNRFRKLLVPLSASTRTKEETN